MVIRDLYRRYVVARIFIVKITYIFHPEVNILSRD